MFVNRERELGVLEEAYLSRKPELVLVYGRRRLGKTHLVRAFLSKRYGLYLVVNYSDRELALRDLSRQVSAFFGVNVSFNWMSDLLEFTLKMLGQRPVLVIDEFQRLSGTGLLAELQNFWDTKASIYAPLIVLVGSGVGTVEKLTMSYDSPIYGRVTRILKLQGFGYSEARVFTKNWAPEDKVRGYSVFGGTPYYLSLIDDEETLEDNIARLIVEPSAPLREEPLSIIQAETREPDRYIAILEAIAAGKNRPSEIAAYTGIPRDSLTKYLHVLEEGLGLVTKLYPVGLEGKPRYGRYYLTDMFFEFWFSEIHRHRWLVETSPREALKRIMSRIDERAGRAWEEVARQHMLLLLRRKALSFTRIGKWWHRGIEIDLVALDEENSTVYFVECKWGEADAHTARKLIAKAQHFPWRREKRREKYIIYARRARSLPSSVEFFLLDNVEEDMEKEAPLVMPTP